MGDALFELHGVSKSFGEKSVLENINLQIFQGEILGIIGASGSGKTTLLNLLVGFLKPTKGEVKCHLPFKGGSKNFNVLERPILVNRLYGFASQHTSFYSDLTVLENLFYFGKMYDLPFEIVKRNAETLVKLLNLRDAKYTIANHLSGGMQRRLDIACALIHNPKVLIMDEPTSDLDPLLRNQVWEIVKRINSSGTTVILSSHHLNEIEALCDRVLMLKDKKIADIGSPAKLKQKYSQTEELMIETFPGDYDKIIPKLQNLNIFLIKRTGTYLTIKTSEPVKVIPKILEILSNHKESLLDIRLIKPNLDDVFVKIYGGKK